jgi:hypothetical protein
VTRKEYEEARQLFPAAKLPAFIDVDPWWWHTYMVTFPVEDMIGQRLQFMLVNGRAPDDKGGQTYDEQTGQPGPRKLYHVDLCNTSSEQDTASQALPSVPSRITRSSGPP